MDGGSSNEKMQNKVMRGHVGSRDPLFLILAPPNISEVVEARNFKFGIENAANVY